MSSIIINHSLLDTRSIVTCYFFKCRILNIYLQREIEDPFKRMHRANNPQKLDARSLCSNFIKVAFYFVDLVHTLFVHARIQ